MVKQSIAKLTGLPVNRPLVTGVMLFMGMALAVQHADAQIVPFRVEGTGVGNLDNLSAVGEGNGLHLGRTIYNAEPAAVTWLAADGSILELSRVRLLQFEFSEPDPETGEVVLMLMEEQKIEGGTKRFQKAKAAQGNLISSVITEPFDLNGDVTAIPFKFILVGEIDLGRRR